MRIKCGAASPLPAALALFVLATFAPIALALVPNIMGYGAKGLPMGGLQRNIFSQPEKRLTSRQRPPPLLVLRKDGALADDTGDRWDLAREETRAAAWGPRRRQAHAPLPARPSRGGELSRLAQAPGAGGESVEGAESEGADDDDAGRRGHGKGFRNGFMGALTDTKFDKDIFALAIPALGSLIIEPVVRTLEAVMVGRLGAAPLGALSIGGSVVSVSFPLFNFFSYATTPMVARALARNDPDEASRLVAQGIWLSTMVGTALGFFMFFCADGILTTMGANAEIYPLARAFLLIRSVSAPAELWLLVAKGASYGHQNTKSPLFAITVGSAAHLVLDYVLIVYCKLSISGAAYAVVISQYMASLILLRSLVANKILKLKDLLMLPDITKILTYLNAGSALLVRTMSMQGFYTIMTSVGARMGTAVIAGHAIARQCSSLEALVVDGLAVAAQSLIAMYMGKGDTSSARRICRRLLLLGGVAGTLLGLLLLVLSHPIAAAFTSDPNVLFEARRAMPLVAAIQLPAALAYIFDGIFLGARDFRFLGIAMMFCVMPATAVLLFVSSKFNVGLLTLWMASGTLLLARVAVLSWRYNSSEGPLQDKQIAKQRQKDAQEDRNRLANS